MQARQFGVQKVLKKCASRQTKVHKNGDDASSMDYDCQHNHARYIYNIYIPTIAIILLHKIEVYYDPVS